MMNKYCVHIGGMGWLLVNFGLGRFDLVYYLPAGLIRFQWQWQPIESSQSTGLYF